MRLIHGLMIFCLWLLLLQLPSDNRQLLIQGTISLAGECLHVAEYRTFLDKRRGLMGVTRLRKNDAALFYFAKSQYRTFWMKGMLMPIDIHFFDDKGEWINAYQNVESCQQKKCPKFRSVKPARFVLETQAKRFLNDLDGERLDFSECRND